MLTHTAHIMEHMQTRVQSKRQIADIYAANGASSLAPLELFKKGQRVVKKGYKWVWCVDGCYDVPVKRVSRNKFELILSSSAH